ncbi:hypothetical protein AaE_014734 [Aphanomyces astaci]|uniref:Crinkler effector protein N-terminal domain-containing protein n=2 Tax=Aphanomyces astaci TaxID=112090 RepID=A0A6A4ZBS4_APHAT|nr:hypothetical protein AaE_014734 [Aphanomyces astaci]
MTKTLKYLVIGDGRIGDVEVEDDQRVYELKKMIRDHHDYSIDAKDIRFYLAKTKDGKWLTTEDDKVKMVTINRFVHQSIKDMMRSGNLMAIARLLNDPIFGFPSDSAAGEIHMLVDVPRLRATSYVVNRLRYPVTEYMTLYPPALVLFWKDLRADQTVVEANAVVELPEGTYLLGYPALGSKVYIRPCYPPLWKLCWEIIHDPKSPHLVILGNPGIGKTFFGFFILLQLARENKTVVYESGMWMCRYLLSGDTVVEGTQDDFFEVLNQPTTYYIVDGVTPPKFQAKIILLTQSKCEVWCPFYRIPTKRCLIQRLTLCKCHWLTNAVKELDIRFDASHRLLHYQVSDKFMKLHVDFASQYVQDKVFTRAWNANPRRLVEFMTAASYTGRDEFAVLRVRMFESYVHSVLPRGGRFQIRRLEPSEGGSGEANADQDDKGGEDEEKADDGAVETKGDVAAQVMAHGTGAGLAAWDIHEDEGIVEVSPQRAVVFNTKAKVASAASGTYLRPAIKHDLPVDAIVKPDMLVTIAAKLLNKQMDLDDALDLLGNPVAPRLFFVLPPGEFDDFPYQRDFESKGNAKGVFKSVIQQFAMQVTPAVVQREMTQPSRDGPSKVAKRSRHE